MIAVGEIEYQYQTNPPHRSGAPNKSQWTIPLAGEHDCFRGALEAGWRDGNIAWGFHQANGIKQQLGLDRDHATPAYIARFEAKNQPEVWHGYPVGRQDPPTQEVIRIWLENDVLPPAKLAKIAGRRKWSL